MNQVILRKNGRRGAVPDYLRVQDIVERMGVSEETVRIWIRKKLLPAMRIGRDYFIDPGDFEEFLKRHRTDRKDDKA
jgi:excisionase family DNA binding protein